MLLFFSWSSQWLILMMIWINCCENDIIFTLIGFIQIINRTKKADGISNFVLSRMQPLHNKYPYWRFYSILCIYVKHLDYITTNSYPLNYLFEIILFEIVTPYLAILFRLEMSRRSIKIRHDIGFSDVNLSPEHHI